MKVLIIYGPTVSGKTDLALQLARKFQGELISADSRQVYKRLDIGTGKVGFDSKVEKHRNYWTVDGVKIYGFDLANPGRQFTAAEFIKFASTALIRIDAVNKLPIIVGGTGFYIKALIDGIDTLGIPQDEKLRKKLEKLSTLDLYQKLLKLEQSRAKKMNRSDSQNPRRLIRAIEVASSKLTIPPSHYPTIPPSNRLLISLTAPNDFLYKRADRWLDIRLKKGMIEEVKNLRSRVSDSWLINLGLEYRWLTKYLKGELTKSNAIDRLKGDIHSLIRRQKTYFNQLEKINLFDISNEGWRKQLEKKVHTWYNQ